MKENVLLEKSKEFALMSVTLYKKMIQKQEFVLSKQFLRCATSIGANLHEAVSGQSKKDFFAKVCIAYKEANETEYWLWLIESSNTSPCSIEHEKALCKEIIKMLAKTKITTEHNIAFDKS